MTKWKRLNESKGHREVITVLTFKVLCPSRWTDDQARQFAIMNIWGFKEEDTAAEVVGDDGDEALVVLV